MAGRVYGARSNSSISLYFPREQYFPQRVTKVGDLLNANLDYNYPSHIKAILILVPGMGYASLSVA